MCSKQKLYEALPQERVGATEKSSRRLTSAQIEMATDCLRVLANRQDVSIGEMSHLLRQKRLYSRFYSMLRRSPRMSKMQLVNQIQKAL